jgi:hypothetical protein
MPACGDPCCSLIASLTCRNWQRGCEANENYTFLDMNGTGKGGDGDLT